MSATRDKLLAEFTTYRWFIMRQLADEAEERGATAEAKGWRWLAENERWPSSLDHFYFRLDWHKCRYFLPASSQGNIYKEPYFNGQSTVEALQLAADHMGGWLLIGGKE